MIECTMKRKQLTAWAAGFFEGEGTISKSSRGRWAIQVQQNNIESLLRLQEALGGDVHGPYERVRGGAQKVNKPYWVWRVPAAQRVQVLTLLEPLLVEKQLKARQALEELR